MTKIPFALLALFVLGCSPPEPPEAYHERVRTFLEKTREFGLLVLDRGPDTITTGEVYQYRGEDYGYRLTFVRSPDHRWPLADAKIHYWNGPLEEARLIESDFQLKDILALDPDQLRDYFYQYAALPGRNPALPPYEAAVNGQKILVVGDTAQLMEATAELQLLKDTLRKTTRYLSYQASDYSLRYGVWEHRFWLDKLEIDCRDCQGVFQGFPLHGKGTPYAVVNEDYRASVYEEAALTTNTMDSGHGYTIRHEFENSSVSELVIYAYGY